MMGFFSAESVKSLVVRDYAFPQALLWKSGPDGAVPSDQTPLDDRRHLPA
jgi:hypothetical protein